MMKRFLIGLGVLLSAVVVLPQLAYAEEPVAQSCEAIHCPVQLATAGLAETLQGFKAPELIGPYSRTVTYSVTTRGTITADLADFKVKVAETYADARGWSRLKVYFKEVASGGDYTVVLSEASQVPTFGSPCDSEYSCRVGRYVIINQDRWLGATAPWNAANGSLRDYRHMVVNHETGHWLGHPHVNCSGAGNAAAVMQQQSINLQGCKFNPWPLSSEIWSTRLGI